MFPQSAPLTGTHDTKDIWGERQQLQTRNYALGRAAMAREDNLEIPQTQMAVKSIQTGCNANTEEGLSEE